MSDVGSRRATAFRVALMLGLGLTATGPAQAQTPDFYQGKTVRMLVGATVGGGYDTYGRFFARYLPRFLPGHPNVVVENMLGAAGIVMANYLFHSAPKDGTVLGISAGSVVTTSILEVGAPLFDASRFTWIGSMNSEVGLIASWYNAPVKTADDLFTTELVVGGTSASDDNVVFPYMLNNVLGTKMKVVPGYTGTPTIAMAMERGEVQGIGSWHYSSMVTSKPDWLRDHKVNFLVQLSLAPHPDIPAVPTVLDLARNDAQRQMMELLFAQQTMGRPIFAPPDIPADRAQALRAAFAALIADPEVLQDAKAHNIEINQPMLGDAMTVLIDKLNAMPPEVVASARAAVRRPTDK